MIFASARGTFNTYDAGQRAHEAFGYRFHDSPVCWEDATERDEKPAAHPERPPPACGQQQQQRAPDAGDAERRDLPAPIVETVDLERVRTWAEPGAADVIAVVTDPAIFEAAVVRPDQRGVQVDMGAGRTLRVSAKRLHRLIELRYIRLMRRPPEWGSVCSIFFVPKDENYDRTIYNGIPLNARCNPPPNVAFAPLHDMLAALTRPDVGAYRCYDFSTWFVQLRAHPQVQRVFCVRRADGVWYRMTGLPMGWSWAPVIAQRVAETIVRETMRRLGAGVAARVTTYVYIDNVVYAVRRGEFLQQDLDAIDRMFRIVCAEAGAALKESASVVGATVDWLGCMLTAGSRHVCFRAAFVAKCAEVEAEMLRPHYPVRLAWKAIAVTVRALWVAQRPLAEIADALRWLVRTAVALGEDRLRWDSPCVLWAAALAQLRRVWAWLRDTNGAFEVMEVDSAPTGCWGNSDAAGAASGARGFHPPTSRQI